jgi:hypothetical protein
MGVSVHRCGSAPAKPSIVPVTTVPFRQAADSHPQLLLRPPFGGVPQVARVPAPALTCNFWHYAGTYFSTVRPPAARARPPSPPVALTSGTQLRYRLNRDRSLQQGESGWKHSETTIFDPLAAVPTVLNEDSNALYITLERTYGTVDTVAEAASGRQSSRHGTGGLHRE